MNVIAAQARCLKYRRRILEISQKVTAHIAPAFSCLEIVDVVQNVLMRDVDLFVLSKGHGVLAQYAVLEDRGVISAGKLDKFCNGALGGHPDRGDGIEASTGSLGHGLGISVGMAYAEKLKMEDTIVYVVISDGELQEGSTWEAIQMAANLRLDNLVLLIDRNDFSCLEKISEVHHAVYPIKGKFEDFRWEVEETNGHDASRMHEAIKARLKRRPFALICHTVKGRGVAFMENVPIWHYRSPKPDEYEVAIQNLGEISG